MEAKPLIVIVGPTASGKTSLAIEIAKRHGGEIICADSRTVYKYLDIGTAKPTAKERSEVPHWGLDIVMPGQRFTAADFKRYALNKIADIRNRGLFPILVGGTGLYVDGVIFDYQFGEKHDEKNRQILQKLTIEELQDYCIRNNIKLPQNSRNKRYIIRAIEQKTINKSKKSEPITNCLIVGITTPKDILMKRITQRGAQIIEQGVVEEAKNTAEKYGWEHESMTGNIYPLCKQYIDGGITKQELIDKFITLDWRLAKRQLTWLKRNKYITWKTREEAGDYITDVLATEH